MTPLSKIKPCAACISTVVLLLVALSCGDGKSELRRQITPDNLASILLPAGEVGEVLGIARPEFEPRPGELGQEFEGIDGDAYGLLSGHAGVYGASEKESGVGITLALFETADGASRCLGDILARLEQQIDGDFDPGDVADEARGLLFTPSPGEPDITEIVVRRDTVVAFVYLLDPGSPDVQADARELAKRVVEKIDALGGS